MPDDIHWEPVPWHGNPKAPNEHEVLEQQRAAHAAWCAGCGDWASYYAFSEPERHDGRERERD